MKTTFCAAVPVLMLGVLFLSGCAPTDGGGSLSKLADCGAVTAADGPGAGSAAAHGQAQRDDGEIRVSQEGDEYRATQLIDLSNDFGGASLAQVDLASFNGSVQSCAREGGGYRIHVTLEGRGASEAEARSALQGLQVTHEDMLVAGTLRLNTRVQPTDMTGSSITLLGIEVGQGGAQADSPRRSAHIVAGLPPAAGYTLQQSTGNGNVGAAGLSGSSASLDSSNGSVGLEGRWDSASLDTGNGVAAVSGDYADLSAHSGNGYVQAALHTVRSLQADLSAGNGFVEVALAGSGAGYDLTADTINGRASIDVSGTEAVGEQSMNSAHRRSADYASRAVQVQVSASSSNGDALIHQ